MTTRETLELAAEFAAKLRDAGAMHFECEWFTVDLQPAEMVAAKPERELEDDDEHGSLSDPDLYPTGYVPGYTLRRRDDA